MTEKKTERISHFNFFWFFLYSEIMTDQTFAAFDFDPRLARAISQLDFTKPTPIQAQGIPLALAGKDILARARTGSGKTAAYAMPIVQKILTENEASREEHTSLFTQLLTNLFFFCIVF
jgi:superfamily II DNA/RNA helicase